MEGRAVIPQEVRVTLDIGLGTKLIVVARDDAVMLQKIETVRGKMRMQDIMEIARNVSGKFKLGMG